MMLCGLWGERTTEKVKLLRQFLVIMAVSFVGEILHAVLPLPIPASIYGLVLMLALLMTGALKLDTVEDADHAGHVHSGGRRPDGILG